MGRSSSTASSPTVSGTKLGAYPPVRVATHHYASSDTTLAESLPSSPQYQPPPYGDEALASPPQYHDDFFEREKRHGEPLPKKTLVVRLCTSIFIAFIVCLIVAAVVGRIHDTQMRKGQDAQHTASRNANGTRYTMMVEGMSAKSTSMTATTTMTANHTTTAHSSIARPTGMTVATYSCPYIVYSANNASVESNSTALNETTCGLKVPFDNAYNQTSNGSIAGVSLYSLKNCMIARTVYHVSNSTLGYRCALSCTEDGGPGIDGLEDGWKWRCD